MLVYHPKKRQKETNRSDKRTEKRRDRGRDVDCRALREHRGDDKR